MDPSQIQLNTCFCGAVYSTGPLALPGPRLHPAEIHPTHKIAIGRAWVHCTRCGWQSAPRSSDKQAIDEWNSVTLAFHLGDTEKPEATS